MDARKVVTTVAFLVFGVVGLLGGLVLGSLGGTGASLLFFAAAGFAVGSMFGAPIVGLLDVVLFRKDMTTESRMAWAAICLLGFGWLGAFAYFGLGDERTRRLFEPRKAKA